MSSKSISKKVESYFKTFYRFFTREAFLYTMLNGNENDSVFKILKKDTQIKWKKAYKFLRKFLSEKEILREFEKAFLFELKTHLGVDPSCANCMENRCDIAESRNPIEYCLNFCEEHGLKDMNSEDLESLGNKKICPYIAKAQIWKCEKVRKYVSEIEKKLSKNICLGYKPPMFYYRDKFHLFLDRLKFYFPSLDEAKIQKIYEDLRLGFEKRLIRKLKSFSNGEKVFICSDAEDRYKVQ